MVIVSMEITNKKVYRHPKSQRVKINQGPCRNQNQNQDHKKTQPS